MAKTKAEQFKELAQAVEVKRPQLETAEWGFYIAGDGHLQMIHEELEIDIDMDPEQALELAEFIREMFTVEGD